MKYEKKQTKKKQYLLIIGATAIIFIVGTLFGYAGSGHQGPQPTGLALLGKYVFWDKISEPQRMACVTCHNPKVGWIFTNMETNLGQVGVTGADPHTNGILKPPSNAYATFIDEFQTQAENPDCPAGLGSGCGGNFWDGRAEGRSGPNAAQIHDAATKHIGEEVFFDPNGTPGGLDLRLAFPIIGIGDYADHFDPTADQALNPMPNPVEQNIERKAVCEHVQSSDYASLYQAVWGVQIDCSDTVAAHQALDLDGAVEKQFDISFKRLMLAVCAYQAHPEVNSFTSKRDFALRAELACACEEFGPGDDDYPGAVVCNEVDDDPDPSVCGDPNYTGSPGKFPLVTFTEIENWGHDLFYGRNDSGLNDDGEGGSLKNASCAACHLSGDDHPDSTSLDETYADDNYHNPGFPDNPEIIHSEDQDPNIGLAGHTDLAGDIGRHKTPTLRNVCKMVEDEEFYKAYGHKGWFKTVEAVVHFYNTSRDLATCGPGIVTVEDALANNCWPAPAYTNGRPPPFIVGRLLLTPAEEAAVVAYLHTLSDLYTPKAPKPTKKKK